MWNLLLTTFRFVEQLSLENTSERLIKTIAELRRKIFIAKEKLEKEIQVKAIIKK